MDDTQGQVWREIAQAQRIVDGLSDERSRRVMRDYIRELEAKVRRGGAAIA